MTGKNKSTNAQKISNAESAGYFKLVITIICVAHIYKEMYQNHSLLQNGVNLTLFLFVIIKYV